MMFLLAFRSVADARGGDRLAGSRVVEMVEPRRVARGDQPALLLGYVAEDALQDRARARERRLGVRVVGPPREEVDTDRLAVADPDGVFLKAQEDVSAEEVARHRVGRVPVPVGTTGAL